MGEASKVSEPFFVMGQSKRLIAKKKLELGRHPKLTTIDHNISQ
jgi:hypothetical protein